MKTIKLMLAALLVIEIVGLRITNVYAEPVRVAENLRGETVILPGSAPDTADFVLVSSFKIFGGQKVAFIVAVYDDPKTRIEVDYIEVYQGTGDLLGIAWLDEFGILRTALDYSLVEEEPARLTGVLILLDEGNPA